MLEKFTNCGGALDFFVQDADTNELFARENYSWHTLTLQTSDQLAVWIQFQIRVTETTI